MVDFVYFCMVSRAAVSVAKAISMKMDSGAFGKWIRSSAFVSPMNAELHANPAVAFVFFVAARRVATWVRKTILKEPINIEALTSLIRDLARALWCQKPQAYGFFAHFSRRD